MNLKHICRWFPLLLVVGFLPGVLLAKETVSNDYPDASVPANDASRQNPDSRKDFTQKNSNSASTEKKNAVQATKGKILKGKVVYVVDGDTLILQVTKTKYNIRLLGIDAPEGDQPFGNQAKKALSDKVLEKTVQVITYGQDVYGNTLGIVDFEGRNICLEMAKEGFAWHYKEYSSSKTLANAEEDARKAKIGLWAEKNPVPPWQWRRQTNENEPEDPFEVKANDSNPAKSIKPQGNQAQNYWLTASSNTRHNSKCRYYQKTKGRACGPNEGTPCKLCGG